VTRALASLALLLAFGGFHASSRRQARTQSPPRLQDFEVSDIGALDALVRLGELYDRPMGIICANARIASRKVTVRVLHASFRQALRALIVKLPGYSLSEDNSVVLVRPTALPPQTEKVLSIVIPRIAAENIDIDALSFRL
jgi:hypothetical protein